MASFKDSKKTVFDIGEGIMSLTDFSLRGNDSWTLKELAKNLVITQNRFQAWNFICDETINTNSFSIKLQRIERALEVIDGYLKKTKSINGGRPQVL